MDTETNFDAQVALHGYDEKFLTCRDLRHPWEFRGCFRKDGQVRRVLHCSRCDTERIDLWLENGERVNATYHYPDGYQLIGGKVRPVDVRRETLSRVRVFDTEADMIRSVISSKTRRNQKG